MRKARRLRQRKHLSLLDVGTAIGVDKASISRFENGKSMLRGGNLILYARLLKCKVDDLLQEVKEDGEST